MRILVVEDEEALASGLKKGLSYHHYQVDLAFDGEDGLYKAKIHPYDLVILDLNLPKLDGVTLCQKLRAEGRTMPILMLTARRTTDEKVLGLDSGADDYLSKPFEFQELLARVRALLRRGADDKSPVLQVLDLTLNPATREVTREGKVIPMRKKDYAILEFLMRHAGDVVTKTAILEHAWDMNADPITNVIEAHIKTIRQAIDRDFAIKLIHTVHGVGYKLSDKPE